MLECSQSYNLTNDQGDITLNCHDSKYFPNLIIIHFLEQVGLLVKCWSGGYMRYLRDERPQQRIGHSGSESQTGRQENEGHIVTQSKEGHSSSGGDQGYHGDDLILKLTNSR